MEDGQEHATGGEGSPRQRGQRLQRHAGKGKPGIVGDKREAYGLDRVQDVLRSQETDDAGKAGRA